MNSKVLIALLISIFCFESEARLSRGQRRQCRENFRECRSQAGDSNARAACRRTKRMCLNGHQGMTCKQIYNDQAQKWSQHRRRIMVAGGLAGIGGLGAGLLGGTLAAFTAGPQALMVIPTMGTIAGLGGILYGLGSIATPSEVIYGIAYDDVHRDLSLEETVEKRMARRMRKHVGKHNFTTLHHVLGPIFREGIESGEFCARYPRLTNVRQAIRYANANGHEIEFPNRDIAPENPEFNVVFDVIQDELNSQNANSGQ